MTVSNRQIAEGILKAKALIDTEDKWVVGAFGRNSEGDGLARGNTKDRVAMCLTSAFDVAADGNEKLWLGMAKAILKNDSLIEDDYHVPTGVCHLNNSSFHGDLMAKMDGAVERLKVAA